MQRLPDHVRLCEPLTEKVNARAGVRGESMRLGGEWHNFSGLTPWYGRSFTERYADAFALTYQLAHGVTFLSKGRAVIRMLVALGIASNTDDVHSSVVRTVDALRDGTTIDKSDMIDAVETYVSSLRDLSNKTIVSSTNVHTRMAMIDMLSMGLKDLSAEAIWPNIGSLKHNLNYLVGEGNILSLGELVRPGSEAASTVAAEIDSLNRLRLARLKKRMVEVLLEEERIFDLGRCLLARSDLAPFSTLTMAVKKLKSYTRAKIKELPWEVTYCFPVDDDETRIANILRYTLATYGRVSASDWDKQFKYLVRQCGGIFWLRRFAEGGSRALMAAHTIVLIDTGLNIQPCDTLSASPFVGEIRRGRRRLRTVSSTKNRAGYKVVSGAFEELDTDIGVNSRDGLMSGSKAIEIWQKLSAPTRARAHTAGSEAAKLLWIVEDGNTPGSFHMYTHPAFCVWWRDFVAEHADDEFIGGLPIQRRMIRATRAQIVADDNGGDAYTVSRMLGHSRVSTTTRFYLNKRHVLAGFATKVREFVNLLEASISRDAPNRGSQLGIAGDVWQKRCARAVETGLGFQCEDPQAGVQPGVPKGTTCDRVEACPHCPMLRFHPTAASLVDLDLTKRSLEARREQYLNANPSRWLQVWEPLLALVTAAEEILEAGPKRRFLVQASATVQSSLSNGSAHLFEPW